MKKIKKIQGAPAGRVKGSSQDSSLEPLRIRERRDSHGQKPSTRGDPGSRIFLIFFVFLPFQKKPKKSKKFIDFFDFFVFWPFRKKSKNKKKILILLIFWFFEKKSKKSKNEKIKKIQGAPAGRVEGSSQGSSLEPLRIRERRDSHGQKPSTRGDPGSRIFFIFFIFLIFFVFCLSKKIKKIKKKIKKIKKMLLIFLIFFAFSKKIKKIKKMKKIKKIQGAPAGTVKGQSRAPARAPACEPLRIRERRDSHGQKPPTRGDPGSRIFFIFLIFSFLGAFSKKIKKPKNFFF